MYRTDNPVLDAERYYAEQEIPDSWYPTCKNCGGTIWDETCYVMDKDDARNTCICKDCKRKALSALNVGVDKSGLINDALDDYMYNFLMDTPVGPEPDYTADRDFVPVYGGF